MGRLVPQGQRLCLSPLHWLCTISITSGGSPLLCKEEKRKSAFPNDAVGNYLELTSGLVSEQHF